MTARARALEWFIEPSPPASRPTALAALAEAPSAGDSPATASPGAAPPVRGPRSARSPDAAPLAAGPRVAAPLAVAPPGGSAAGYGDVAPFGGGSVVVALRSGSARYDAPAGEAGSGVGGIVTSAAVLGRPGEAEPVAAALALALRRDARAKAAAVAIVAAAPAANAGGSGTAGARRLAARLEAHGLEGRVRGRLVWMWLDPEDPQLVAAARRVTLVAAPAVLAVTAPRTAAIDEALAEQDLLVIVTAEPEGPLARLAAGGLAAGVPVLVVRPLTRGPARSLVRAGVRPARPIRDLLPASRGQRQ